MLEGLPLILNRLEISLDEKIGSILVETKLIKPTPKNQLIYHYTNLEGLKKIVESKTLYFSNSAFLNDKQEFLKGSESFENIVSGRIENELEKISKSILERLLVKISETKKSERYVSCFSIKADLLSQWRAYSNDGKGVCIAFDYNKLKKIFDGIESFPIIYEDKIQIQIAKLVLDNSIEFYLKNFKILNEFSVSDSDSELLDIISIEIYNQVSKYIGQFKHSAFDEEKEFRFEIRIDNDIENKREVLFRCGRNDLFVPYIEEVIKDKEDIFPIKEIIIGPSLNSELNKISISDFLISKGYNIRKIDVKESFVPYRI